MATVFGVIIYMTFISLGIPDSLPGSAWPAIRPDLGGSFGFAGILSMIVAGGTIVSRLSQCQSLSNRHVPCAAFRFYVQGTVYFCAAYPTFFCFFARLATARYALSSMMSCSSAERISNSSRLAGSGIRL
ncbi:hypothetical protein SK3146_00843 [Paenibacillus konkukensis]|uniref:Uncharacterized protein n=1 Tax=Paenibacillus konkukensis TaxID=2020716 RepID=A0ABY4RH46_9BACL|nr:hypothetical protein SK3146_00843 [Paenibacillus konkukensis]